MKKLSILVVLLAFASLANAQTKKIIGSWLMTRVEVDGDVHEPYFITDFKESGKMEVMGMEAGTWKYDKATHSIVMESELDKDFNGKGKILKLDKKELVVSKDGAKLYYTKVDVNLISERNKVSGLIGNWEFKDMPYADATTYLTFKEPDEFSIIEKEPGVESRLSGTWIFDKEKMSLIMIGLRGEDNFNGQNKIVNLDKDKLEIKYKGQIFRAKKLKENNIKIERLAFSEEDFYDEDGEYKYYDEEYKLPWQDAYEKIMSLENVQQLVYNYAKLIEGTEMFQNKTLSADVKANAAEGMLSIDYIFEGYDKNNIPEDSELPSNMEYTSLLFPLNGDTFRIVGTEQLTTAAGTFDCTVIEALGDFDLKLKLWMINDKPGVYAKIIQDKPGSFGQYAIYELQEIK